MKHFKNESREYREARDRLLRSEIALREQMETVARERRKLRTEAGNFSRS